jgi:hypothetical protein
MTNQRGSSLKELPGVKEGSSLISRLAGRLVDAPSSGPESRLGPEGRSRQRPAGLDAGPVRRMLYSASEAVMKASPTLV